ncbi:hypothetical protein DLAC_02912 [Tieghemostelium lacteum]|uniref:Uncharacterized protein n=1 Tax=Tieghemostelium lacteum TaxID=361077 RepID=A0A152A440_TIELA|nr:hypothetical protein DLAC_02912 [Tieghemostelium lacteum]|eukprot:KYR00855.1 hypothetical protein DLAC_02912 [Tieghemostelium lacteum]
MKQVIGLIVFLGLVIATCKATDYYCYISIMNYEFKLWSDCDTYVASTQVLKQGQCANSTAYYCHSDKPDMVLQAEFSDDQCQDKTSMNTYQTMQCYGGETMYNFTYDTAPPTSNHPYSNGIVTTVYENSPCESKVLFETDILSRTTVTTNLCIRTKDNSSTTKSKFQTCNEENIYTFYYSSPDCSGSIIDREITKIQNECDHEQTTTIECLL